MTHRHSSMQHATATDRGISADQLAKSPRTAITPDRQRAPSKHRLHPNAVGPAPGDAGRRFSRSSTSAPLHTSTAFEESGVTRIKLFRRIERLEARAPARVDIEADIQAASAILNERDIWKRNSMLAQKAMVALSEVYGLEALLLMTR
jgi:hypothetical protein